MIAKLFTSFGRAFKKPIKKPTTSVAKSKTIIANPFQAKKIAPTYTQTKMQTSSKTAFGRSAVDISKAGAKMAGYTALGLTAVGGGLFVMGTGGGKGAEQIGYGWRRLTGNENDLDIQNANAKYLQTMANISEQNLKNMMDYDKWRISQGMSDAPSTREVFENFYQQPNTAQSSNSGVNSLLLVGGIVIAGGAAYLVMKKKGAKK